MPLIFFDANVYLHAYREGFQEYLTLLPYASALRPHMLVTEMLVREVNRNRLSTYLDYRRSYKIQEAKFPAVFPHHTKNDHEKDEFDKEYSRLMRTYDSSMRELSNFIANTHENSVKAISQGTDYMSLSLRGLLSNPVPATETQLKRARVRRELGDPPGKYKDPLGDQLNWEQLLDAAREKEIVWIVTTDQDYCYVHNDRAFLHPTLHTELNAVPGITDIHCFNRLGDFFENLRGRDILESKLLPSRDLTKAANTEIDAVKSPSVRFVDLSAYPDNLIVRGYQKPCPKTVSGAHVVEGAALFPSPYSGNLTFQGPCILCGQWTDTQELSD